jgi:hypothetical protein
MHATRETQLNNRNGSQDNTSSLRSFKIAQGTEEDAPERIAAEAE